MGGLSGRGIEDASGVNKVCCPLAAMAVSPVGFPPYTQRQLHRRTVNDDAVLDANAAVAVRVDHAENLLPRGFIAPHKGARHMRRQRGRVDAAGVGADAVGLQQRHNATRGTGHVALCHGQRRANVQLGGEVLAELFFLEGEEAMSGRREGGEEGAKEARGPSAPGAPA